MGPSKSELICQLAEARAANRSLEEKLERTAHRLELVFVVSKNAMDWLEGIFGPLVDHGREQDEAVHRYIAVDETAAIRFDPRSGDIIVTDPKELVVGDVTIRLNPWGDLDVAGMQRIETFLDKITLSRLPRSTMRINGPISFSQPRPKQEPASDDGTAAELTLAGGDTQH